MKKVFLIARANGIACSAIIRTFKVLLDTELRDTMYNFPFHSSETNRCCGMKTAESDEKDALIPVADEEKKLPELWGERKSFILSLAERTTTHEAEIKPQ